MSKVEKKAPLKAIVKAERAIKPNVHVPAKHVERTFDQLMEDFRRNFRDSIWGPWEMMDLEPTLSIRETSTDMVDAGNKFIVHAEMPGIPKDKIDITVTKEGIEISAETNVGKEEKEKSFVVRERNYSHIYKVLSFPEEVIPEKAESTLKDGLLEISIPKKTPAPEPKKHKVIVK